MTDTKAVKERVEMLVGYANKHRLPDDEPIGLTNLRWIDLRALLSALGEMEETIGILQAAAEQREGGLRDMCDRVQKLEDALALLIEDVGDYPAWQRPCHALELARRALTQQEEGK